MLSPLFKTAAAVDWRHRPARGCPRRRLPARPRRDRDQAAQRRLVLPSCWSARTDRVSCWHGRSPSIDDVLAAGALRAHAAGRVARGRPWCVPLSPNGSGDHSPTSSRSVPGTGAPGRAGDADRRTQRPSSPGPRPRRSRRRPRTVRTHERRRDLGGPRRRPGRPVEHGDLVEDGHHRRRPKPATVRGPRRRGARRRSGARSGRRDADHPDVRRGQLTGPDLASRSEPSSSGLETMDVPERVDPSAAVGHVEHVVARSRRPGPVAQGGRRDAEVLHAAGSSWVRLASVSARLLHRALAGQSRRSWRTGRAELQSPHRPGAARRGDARALRAGGVPVGVEGQVLAAGARRTRPASIPWALMVAHPRPPPGSWSARHPLRRSPPGVSGMSSAGVRVEPSGPGCP